VNIFTFTGNLGRDAEVRYTQNGTAVCSFPVANTIRKGPDNEETVWVQCAIFGKRAESKLPQYLTKGTKVSISGQVSLNEWQDNNGNNRAALRCMVNELDLHGGGQQGQQPNQQQGQPPQGGGGQPDFDQDFEDNIPFAWSGPELEGRLS
jgi:single-strand DNA-binding protein